MKIVEEADGGGEQGRRAPVASLGFRTGEADASSGAGEGKRGEQTHRPRADHDDVEPLRHRSGCLPPSGVAARPDDP